MITARMLLLVFVAFLAQGFSNTAIAECYYGSGRYTDGTVLCQAGLRMQCRSNDEGRASWVSMDQQCVVPALSDDGATEPREALEVESRRYQNKASLPKVIVDDNDDLRSRTGATAPRANPRVKSDFVIEILWANYGRDGHTCDAAPALKQSCNGEASCAVAISPEAFCKDPYSGRAKLLSVYWQCTNGESSLMKPPLYRQNDSELTLECG